MKKQEWKNTPLERFVMQEGDIKILGNVLDGTYKEQEPEKIVKEEILKSEDSNETEEIIKKWL